MPRRFRARRKRRPYTRRYKKRFRRYRNISTTFPQNMTRRLRYVDNIELNPGAGGSLAQHSFKTNDIYQPNLTGTTHAAMGFDQMMAIYEHGYVIGAKITVIFNRGNTGRYVVGISLKADSSTVGNYQDAIENQRKKCYYLLGPNVDSGPMQKTLSLGYSMRKTFGKNVSLGGQYFGITTNPTQSYYWQIWAQDLETTADLQPINCLVQIDYLCKFIEPLNDLPSS